MAPRCHGSEIDLSRSLRLFALLVRQRIKDSAGALFHSVPNVWFSADAHQRKTRVTSPALTPDYRAEVPVLKRTCGRTAAMVPRCRSILLPWHLSAMALSQPCQAVWPLGWL